MPTVGEKNMLIQKKEKQQLQKLRKNWLQKEIVKNKSWL